MLRQTVLQTNNTRDRQFFNKQLNRASFRQIPKDKQSLKKIVFPDKHFSEQCQVKKDRVISAVDNALEQATQTIKTT